MNGSAQDYEPSYLGIFISKTVYPTWIDIFDKYWKNRENSWTPF